MRWLAALLTLFFLFVPRDARACGNAVTLEDPFARDLRDAESAIDVGDLRFGRTLAHRVADRSPAMAPRATQLLALADARDPATSPEDLEPLRVVAPTTPAAEELAAEIDARIPAHQAAAHARLERLAEKDLVTSPWGYAALARLESDPAKKNQYLTTCRVQSAAPDVVCRAELAPPPRFVLHGALATYLFAMLFAIVGGAHLSLRRRGRRAPWVGTAYRKQGFAVVGALVLAVVFARELPVLGPLAVLATWLAAIVAERLAYLAAARRGTGGLSLRPAGPQDLQLPAFTVRGLRQRTEVLERTASPDPSYRESARAEPIALVVRKRPSALLVAGGALLLLFGLGAASSMLFLRKSGSAPVRAVELAVDPVE